MKLELRGTLSVEIVGIVEAVALAKHLGFDAAHV